MVRLMILNLRTFGKMVSPEFERSLLWLHFSRFEHLLFQHDGQAFFQLCQNQPQVAVNLLMDLQSLFSRLVEIAKNLTLVNHVVAGGTISKDQFVSIGPLADTIVANLSGMIAMQRPNDTYAMIPQHMFDLMQIKPKKNPPSHGSGSPPAKRTPDDHTVDTPPSKVPKGDKSPSPGTPAKPKTPPADLGFLEYTKDKPATPPSLGFTVAHINKKKETSEYPCPSFVHKGWACDRKKCSLAHVTYKKLSAADQQKFVGYVESHKENVKFVQGQGPSGTT
jgi:hypothetical protein